MNSTISDETDASHYCDNNTPGAGKIDTELYGIDHLNLKEKDNNGLKYQE